MYVTYSFFKHVYIQVFHTAYAYYFRPRQLEEIREVIVDCVRLLHKSYPHLKEKVKVHMLHAAFNRGHGKLWSCSFILH